MPCVDTLIIGQGLAGSMLAWRLVQRGQQVLVIDNDYRTSSSTVAAGLINPVTGKRLVKTVGVDECLPLARQRYGELEQLLNRELLVEKPMFRLFHSGQDRERWQQRQCEAGYRDYLGDIVEASQLPPPVISSHGAGRQLQTAYLRTEPLLQGLREWLMVQHSYRQAQFDYDQLALNEEGVTWEGVTARRAVFCEGHQGANNPWFSWLPFQPAKGEFLTLRSPVPLPDAVINSGRWLMPRGDGLYRVGASYDHRQLDGEPTVEARQMLLAALPDFLSPCPEFEVLAQQAGVRPTTSDRQPFIGRHPQQSPLIIFNGFGSKGSLLIPWHAERLVEFLIEDVALPAMVDIARYREHTVMARHSLVQLAHALVAEVLRQGDIAIDATVGNGHDTLFLATQVGDTGKVYGFDIQQQALDSAYQRLELAGACRQVSLYHAGHETMGFVIPESAMGQVKAVMFNLGYLPGGDKQRTTAASTTLAALQSALSLLAPGGVISLLAYTGHAGGREEAELVKAWASSLPQELFDVSIAVPPSNQGNAPEWVVVHSKG